MLFLSNKIKKKLAFCLFILYICGREKTIEEAMSEDILALEYVLVGSCKSGDVIYATDPSLGRQVRINYATFNSKYPLVG